MRGMTPTVAWVDDATDAVAPWAAILQGEALARCDARTDRELVEEWHNETHAGTFAFCALQPCQALARFAPERETTCENDDCQCDCHW